jgi:hypothetical protein
MAGDGQPPATPVSAGTLGSICRSVWSRAEFRFRNARSRSKSKLFSPAMDGNGFRAAPSFRDADLSGPSWGGNPRSSCGRPATAWPGLVLTRCFHQRELVHLAVRILYKQVVPRCGIGDRRVHLNTGSLPAHLLSLVNLLSARGDHFFLTLASYGPWGPLACFTALMRSSTLATSVSYFTTASLFSIETTACLTPFTSSSADCTAVAHEPHDMPLTSSVIVSSFACAPAGNRSEAIANPQTAHTSLRCILLSSRANYSTGTESQPRLR